MASTIYIPTPLEPYRPQLLSPLEYKALRKSCHLLCLKSKHYNPSHRPPPPPSASPSPCPSTPASRGAISSYGSLSPFESSSSSPLTSPGVGVPERTSSRKPVTFLREPETPPLVCEATAAGYKVGLKSDTSSERSIDPVLTTFDFGFGSNVQVIGKPVLVDVNVNKSRANLLNMGCNRQQPSRDTMISMFPEPPPIPAKTFETMMLDSPGIVSAIWLDRELPPIPAAEEPKTPRRMPSIGHGLKEMGRKVGALSSIIKGWKKN